MSQYVGGVISVGVSDAVRAALEPYVGPMVADTCVRGTALSLGKMSDELDAGDLPSLEANIRKLLGPVAPTATIEDAIADLRQSIALGV